MELIPKAFTQIYEEKACRLITECRIGKHIEPSIHTNYMPIHKNFHALWDTGATHTCIGRKVIDTLGLIPIGDKSVVYSVGAQGKEINNYYVSLILPGDIGLHKIRAGEVDTPAADIIIGMDIIRHGDFSISCKNGNTLFSFQFPSAREIDFVQEYKERLLKVDL